MSVAAGGGANDATPLAGFVGDSRLYAVNVSGTSINRWGDYTAIHRHWPNNKLFSVSDYFLQAPAKPLTAIHQYRLFGRTADVGTTN